MDLEQGYKVAFQIFTLPEGIIVAPSVKRLTELQQVVDEDSKAILSMIIQKRQMMIEQLALGQTEENFGATPPESEDIRMWMYEIRQINEMALRANFLYEEFVLFGVYPNGGQAYQKVRDVMRLSGDAQSISVGLEPLDSNWSLSLHNQETP